jgi:glucose-1-phosphate cytidylyltransferase
MVRQLEGLKVLLLCGGKGERLRPLTDVTPKPLVKIRGKPIIHYLISHFEKFGVRDFVVATGYRADQFEEYFLKHHRHLNIEMVNSGDADIVQRLKDCRNKLPGDFVICYGDTLANVNLSELISFHRSTSQPVTMTTYPLQTQFGIVDIDENNLVSSFVEKPVLDKWINIGYYIFNNEFLSALDEYSSFVNFLNSVVSQKKLSAYRHRGVHITVNTLKELDEAEENITSFEKALPKMGMDLALS